MKFLPLLWSGLWRNRARTLFTMCSVAAAFLLFGMLQGVGAWMSDAVSDAFVDRLYTSSRISFAEPLPLAYQERIARVAGVRQVTHLTWFGGYYQTPSNSLTVYPVDATRVFEVFNDWEAAPQEVEALRQKRDGAVVGRALARRFGWQIGDRVPLISTAWPKRDGSAAYDFEIVGIFGAPRSPQSENVFLINYDYFDAVRASGQGYAGWYAVRVDDPARSAHVAATIDALFRNSAFETRTQSEKEFAQAQVKQFGDIDFIIRSILGAVVFTLLFLTVTTMMHSIRERTSELAVLKAIGFTDNRIMALIVGESGLLCVVAALVGLAFAAFAFPVMRSFIGGTAALPAPVLMQGLAVALALVLATALPPVWHARRLMVADTLAGR